MSNAANPELEAVENTIRKTVEEWNMFPQGCDIVAGLSGGADSMALVHFLSGFARERGLRLAAAHVNHGLRGEEADEDERFVTGWCAENGVELKILHADVRALAAEKNEGLEECGRNVRYSFFRSLCGEKTKIATAHTLSDSTETVLLNLARGAGARGLCGIPPVRGSVVRPLIGVTRAQVEAYCSFYGLSYVTDSTNLSDAYARNRVRHTVIPAMKGINPSFEAAVSRMTGLLRRDEEYLTRLAREKLARAACDGGYRLSELAGEPWPVLSRAAEAAAEKAAGVRLQSVHAEAVANLVRSGRGSVIVAGGIRFAAQGNTLFVLRPGEGKSAPWCVPFRFPETVLPDGRVLSVREISDSDIKNQDKINNLFFHNLLDYDTILNISCVRSRRAGDFFSPAGRGVTKSLKKLFNEAGIPPLRRNRVAILESKGRIVWVEGFGASREARAKGRAAEISVKECR